MIWKVLIIAERMFLKLSAPHLLAEVNEEAKFVKGEKVVRLEKERSAIA